MSADGTIPSSSPTPIYSVFAALLRSLPPGPLAQGMDDSEGGPGGEALMFSVV